MPKATTSTLKGRTQAAAVVTTRSACGKNANRSFQLQPAKKLVSQMREAVMPAQRPPPKPARRVRLSLQKFMQRAASLVGLGSKSKAQVLPPPRAVASRVLAEESSPLRMAVAGKHEDLDSQKSVEVAASLAAVQPSSLIPLEQNHEEETPRFWFLKVLYPTLRHAEQHGPRPACLSDFAQNLLYSRAESVDKIVRLHLDFQLRDTTLFLAVKLLDQYIAQLQGQSQVIGPRRLHLLAASVLVIASKFEDEAVPCFEALAESSAGEFTKEEVHVVELHLLEKLGYRLHVPMAVHHLPWFLELVEASGNLVLLAQYLCEVGLESRELAQWLPTDHAAAAVVLASMMMSKPEWPPAFEAICVGNDEARREAIMHVLYGLCRSLYKTGPGKAVFDKYATGSSKMLASQVATLLENVLAQSASGPFSSSSSRQSSR